MSLLNQNALQFHLYDQNNQLVSLDDFKGQAVVLYFYPKDFTPGCTNQACNYRDFHAEFEKRGVKVIGISADDVASHAKFVNKYDLSTTYLADVDHVMSEAYGVYQLKTSFGVTKMGIVRTTFVLDKNHVVVAVLEKTDPKTDASRVLEIIDSLAD